MGLGEWRGCARGRRARWRTAVDSKAARSRGSEGRFWANVAWWLRQHPRARVPGFHTSFSGLPSGRSVLEPFLFCDYRKSIPGPTFSLQVRRLMKKLRFFLLFSETCPAAALAGLCLTLSWLLLRGLFHTWSVLTSHRKLSLSSGLG